MTDVDELGPRVGATPWKLYQSDALAARRASRDDGGFYCTMLKDDLRNQRYAYDIELKPTGATLARAGEVLLELLDDFGPAGYGEDPAALVCDVAGYLLDESLGADDMLLELHLLTTEEVPGRLSRVRRRTRVGGGEPHSFPSLGFVPAWSVVESGSGLRQTSPETGQPAVLIPERRVFRMQLREPARGTWQQAVRRLRKVDEVKMLGTDMARFAWPGYDFSEQVKAQELAVASATATIGWDGRGAFSKWMTSPYMAYRELRFARFWIEAVGDVVRFLNGVTGSRSLYGDAGFEFALTGLPSADELERAMADMRAGRLSVQDAHSRFIVPKYSQRRAAEKE